MAQGNFDPCVAIVLKEEGGNDDDPNDHGGRTSRGITQREYDAYRRNKGLAISDVWRAPQADILSIYREQYWEPYCDDLPAGLDLAFFDFCVNAGRTQAVKGLQRAMGVSVDGMLGIATKEAITRRSIGELIHDYCDRRRAFYRALAQYSRYGKGWMSRTDRIERAATKMASAVTVDGVLSAPSPKANPKDVATPVVSPEVGAATATTSTVGSGVMDQVQQSVQQIAPFQDTVQIIKYLLLAVAVISFGLTVYGIIKRRNTQDALGG